MMYFINGKARFISAEIDHAVEELKAEYKGKTSENKAA